MTDTTDVATGTKNGALSSMRLADLQSLAGGMGIPVHSKMRKADLVSAIREARGGSKTGVKAPEASHVGGPDRNGHAGAAAAGSEPTASSPHAEDAAAQAHGDTRHEHQPATTSERETRNGEAPGQRGHEQGASGGDNRGDDRQGQGAKGGENRGGDQQGRDNQSRDSQSSQNPQSRDGRGGEHRSGEEDGSRSGRRRNRQRGRDRKRGRGQNQGGSREGLSEEQEGYSDQDVLVPVAGIVDVLDTYAFIRTTGYLPGATDVYVPMGMVRRNGLRKGDAVAGAIKAPSGAEPEQPPSGGGKNNRGKFNALVRLDTVNGMTSEEAKKRPEFGKLTPLYPQERLRLETDGKNLTARIIDLVAPIGKGQRGLIVSPPKAGKTLVLQAIANAITTNNPEAHLMIVLVDERPEEVTDMQRTVAGEVIASTFDRPAEDHTTVAELAIERAKRLVEMGGDVVVLLDSITRLGRAYNLAAPASGRILSGGVDSSALYPPKRFFGAARNIEEGGSLTILATALVETGSKMDEVIFEEFKGTGNMELRLSRQLADRRIFPAVDVNPSGTRREEILLSGEELKIAWKLRRVLTALDSQQALELLLNRLRNTRNNYEFLTQVQQTSSIKLDDED
ncbi:MAG TPA: transcription termination factor Rho [Ornithinimicrobium sp.]|nr:transcription termination factor Rho [Ornithinimicrobium sp.]HKJ12826.1 transcription termination factor Rho [Ornithinimicrobium sp.]